MRWRIGLLSLFLGLAAADASAQLVFRDEVTTTRLTEEADLIVLGEVGRIQTIGESHHESLLIPIAAKRVLKGPEEPGQILVFSFAQSSQAIPLTEGEKPLLFLNTLQKDDLACGLCGKRGVDVLDLPEGNYYLVRGGRWGKLTPGDVATGYVSETMRLKGKKDFPGLKDHWLGGMLEGDERIAVDAAIDLLADEKARLQMTAADSASVVSLLQVDAERFKPIEPLVALVGYSGQREALPLLLDLERSEDPPEVRVMADSLSRLAGSGVPVVDAIRAELESAAVPNAEKENFIELVAEMGKKGLTESVIALADEKDLRKTVLLALGELKDPEGLPILVGSLEKGEMPNRQAAAVALAYYGPEGVQALKEYQAAHPDEELTRFIDELRRNPARVRGRVRKR